MHRISSGFTAYFHTTYSRLSYPFIIVYFCLSRKIKLQKDSFLYNNRLKPPESIICAAITLLKFYLSKFYCVFFSLFLSFQSNFMVL